MKSRDRLKKILEILNETGDGNFTTRELAVRIDPSIDQDVLNKGYGNLKYQARKKLESTACTIGTMLNTLADVGLVGRKYYPNGNTQRVVYFRLKKVEVV